MRSWQDRALIRRKATPSEVNGIMSQRSRGKGLMEMSDTILAYIVSLGLIGAGMGWIIAGPNSPLCTTIGIASIVVGVISVSNEFRHRRGWQKRAVDRLNSFQTRR